MADLAGRVLGTLACVFAFASCAASADVTIGDGNAGSGVPAPTEAQVVAPETSPWPAERPSDLEVSFGQDGGSAPWSEDIEIDGDRAAYIVWMEGTEYTLQYMPTAARLDALYGELVAGRFDLHEAIPFDDDEMIYDAEQQAWSVRFGEFRHRVAVAGNDIASPGLPGAPRAAISGFNDLDAVPSAQTLIHLVRDSAFLESGPGRVDLSIELGDVDVAIGDDRWTDRLAVYLSAPVIGAVVTLQRDVSGEKQVLFAGEFDLADGAEVVLGIGEDGQPVVTAG